MAYTPINWQTGDTITAEKLNKCDNGWSVESSSTTILSETVTTTDTGEGNEGQFAYTDAQINASQITVTFNGTDYTCDAIQVTEGFVYGDDSGEFTNYPFTIFSIGGKKGNETYLYTSTAGTYTVVITVSTTTIEVSDDFETVSQTAVADVLPLKVEFGITTWQDVADAITAGRMVYCIESDKIEPVIYLDTSAYSITCLVYGNGLTTTTYIAGSASGTFSLL